MPANTLLKMATETAIRVVAEISDFADMPYELAHPILVHVRNPQQLRDIEANNPHIAEQSEELWRRFIARDIPDWREKIREPKNKSSWHKVYRFLQRNEEKQAAADEEALRKAMQGEGLKKAQTQTLVVENTLPHPRIGKESNKFVDGISRKDLNGWGQKKQPNLRNAKNGKDIMAAIRRQSGFASSQKSHAAPRRAPSQAQQLEYAKRQITQAPESMLRAATKAPNQLTIAPRELLPHEKEQLAEFNRDRIYNRKIIGPKAPGRLSDLKHNQQHRSAVEASRAKALADNEAKLRRFTTQQKKIDSTPAKPKEVFDFARSPIVVDPVKSNLSPPQHGGAFRSVWAEHDAPPVSSPSHPDEHSYSGKKIEMVEIHTKLSSAERQALGDHSLYMRKRRPNTLDIHQRLDKLPGAKNQDTTVGNNRTVQPPANPTSSSPPPPALPQQAGQKRPAANIFMKAKRRKV